MLFRAFVERFIPGLYGSPIGFLSKDANTQFITLIMYNIFVSFGSSTLLYTGAMNGISPSVMEAAKIDGARPFREFISVVFPMVFSTVSVFIITTVSGFLSNQLYEYTFFQKTITFPTNQTFGYFIYWNTVVSPDQASLPIWATYGFLFSLITIPLVFFIRWLLNKVKNIW